MHRRRVWRASSGKDWIRQNALLFRKLYEDLALGRLSSEQSALLTSGYENVQEFINRILVHELDRETNTRKIGIFYSFAGKADSGEEPTESISYFRQIGADVKSFAV